MPFSLPGNLNLVKAYSLYRKISHYPTLLGPMRELFLQVLVERGIVTREGLAELAEAWRREDGAPDSAETRAEYFETAIDLFFSGSLQPEEIENYINLVRKRDKCQELGHVVNSDRATAETIFKALKEFCDIPKGEVYISPEEAEGIRVSLISYYLSNQLPFVGIAKNFVTIRDIYDILLHAIGHIAYHGMLGGKSAGMIVAQRILLPILSAPDPDFQKYIAVPDTWYITSGVFSDFINRNKFFFAHTHKYKDREAIEEECQRIGGMFEVASFPPTSWGSFASSSRRSASTPSSCAPPATWRTASALPSPASTSPCSWPTRET